jgi:DNA-directed RNA polymerase specialized sigma24 family protein
VVDAAGRYGSPVDRDDLGFAAFVQLNQHLYTRYARVRLSEEAVTLVVIRETFTAARSRWSWLLSRPCPAADVWGELRLRVTREAAKISAPDVSLGRLYEALPHCCADSVILCLRLGLDTEDAAGLMGIERSAVEAALGVARRARLHVTGSEVPLERR